MKMIIALLLAVVLCVLSGCATLALSPEERKLAREFDKISLTADDVGFIKDRGMDPANLTIGQKASIMRQAEKNYVATCCGLLR